MLLSHQKGCKSYEELHTVSNTVYPNFRGACDTLGLIGDAREWRDAFIQAFEWECRLSCALYSV